MIYSDLSIDDKRLLSRVDDAVEKCRRYDTYIYIGFLDERQKAMIDVRFKGFKEAASFRFFGGHDDAERQLLCVYSIGLSVPEDAAFPLIPTAIHYRCEAEISHRNVLGSLLSLGIAREKVGDILCANTFSVVFLHSDIADYVSQNLDKVGRVGVKTESPFCGDLPPFRSFLPLSGTLASSRLDAVIKTLLGVSREQASERIRLATVQLDHRVVTDVSATVKEGTVISVKGVGRFVVRSLSETTKKGRIVLRAEKYI